MRLADRIMHEWLEEVRRIQSGEAAGIRAISLVLSGSVSDCCGVTPTATKNGDPKCPKCHQACDFATWNQLRDKASRGDWTLGQMHVAETRGMDRDREDRRLVRETDRILRLSRMIELVPSDWETSEWNASLAAWGLTLQQGEVEPATAMEAFRFYVLRSAGFGEWTTELHRERIRGARRTVRARVIGRGEKPRAHRRPEVRPAFGASTGGW